MLLIGCVWCWCLGIGLGWICRVGFGRGAKRVGALLREDAIEVETVTATAAASGGSSGGAVLNASGYVVARRQATVSAKVTGKVAEVLIEEGMEVIQKLWAAKDRISHHGKHYQFDNVRITPIITHRAGFRSCFFIRYSRLSGAGLRGKPSVPSTTSVKQSCRPFASKYFHASGPRCVTR